MKKYYPLEKADKLLTYLNDGEGESENYQTLEELSNNALEEAKGNINRNDALITAIESGKFMSTYELTQRIKEIEQQDKEQR